jgi:hypothetical protein
LLDHCLKIKFYEKVHETKRKEQKLFDWKKKKQINKGKIKRYILLKYKTIKTLLYEREETNYK